MFGDRVSPTFRDGEISSFPKLGDLASTKMVAQNGGKEAVTRAPLILDFLCFLRRKTSGGLLVFHSLVFTTGLKSYHRMASCRGVWTVASGALEGSAEASRVSPEHLVTQFFSSNQLRFDK